MIIIWNYVFLLYRLVNKKLKNKQIWYISLILAIMLISYSFYCSRYIEIKHINIQTNKIEENLKIAYLSDIHIDSLNDEGYIEKIAKIINSQWVDLVLINWDLIDWTSFKHSTLLGFNKINIPIYTTLWNHEIYTWVEYIKQLLKKTNIKLMLDQSIKFKWLNILFSNQISSNNKLDWLEKFLKNNVNSENYNIILIHQPIWTDITSKNYIDLQLAWHTHNGQIWPFWYIAKLVNWYSYWMYNIWNMKLYVSSWAWVWWPPFRLWSQNEIIILNFEKL